MIQLFNVGDFQCILRFPHSGGPGRMRTHSCRRFPGHTEEQLLSFHIFQKYVFSPSCSYIELFKTITTIFIFTSKSWTLTCNCCFYSVVIYISLNLLTSLCNFNKFKQCQTELDTVVAPLCVHIYACVFQLLTLCASLSCPLRRWSNSS